MISLRDYQERTVARTLEHWAVGEKRVCVVAPTGAGKTVMGVATVLRAITTMPEIKRAVWLTHRAELIDQTVPKLEALGIDVGIFASGRMCNIEAPVLAMAWQTALDREHLPHADLLVIDECHHGRGPKWQTVIEYYADKYRLGLTATPQRGDGKPLSDVFDHMVVSAKYSELIAAGHLTPCRVFRPHEFIAPDLSKEPLDAYMPFAPRKGIGFARSVELAEEYAEKFRIAGIKSYCIDGTTSKTQRRNIIKDFAEGHTRFLWSVGVLTEGFDVPDAEVCVLARGCSFTGTMMQMAGRILRSADGKTHGVFLDLPGVTWVHGLPTEDREYSLDGRPISSLGSLKVCLRCGTCYAPGEEEKRGCPSCGYIDKAEDSAPPKPHIYNMDLIEVYAGENTPAKNKAAEWDRLRRLSLAKRWGLSWALTEYRKLFNSLPDSISESDLRKEFQRLLQFAVRKGYKKGWAFHQYQAATGSAANPSWMVREFSDFFWNDSEFTE